MSSFGRARRKLLKCCGGKDKPTPRGRNLVPMIPMMPRIEEEPSTEWQGSGCNGNNIGVHISSHAFAANSPSEDATAVHEDDDCVLVGLFDGHGGVLAAQLGAERIYQTFTQCLRESKSDVGRALRQSLIELDNFYLELVNRHRYGGDSRVYLQYLGAGSCAVLLHLDKSDGSYHVANLGDSRIVLGKQCPYMNSLTEAVALTVDHSCKTDSERYLVRSEHPNDSNIIKERWDEVEFAWLLKGRAQFTRSIGDVIFKDPHHTEFYNTCVGEDQAHRRLLPVPDPKHPYISNRADSTLRRAVQGDYFLIMACDGLWDEMSNDMAVTVVDSLVAEHGRNANIAKLLIKFALERVVRRLAHEEPELEINALADLEALPPGAEGRRGLHDDISVIVIFFEQTNLQPPSVPTLGSAPWSNVSGGNDYTPRDTGLSIDTSRGTDTSRIELLDSSRSYTDSARGMLPEELATPRTARPETQSREWFGPALRTEAPWVDVRKANNKASSKSVKRANDGSQTARRQTLLNEWAVLSGLKVEVLEQAFNAISPKANRVGLVEDNEGGHVVQGDDQELGNEVLMNLIREAQKQPVERVEVITENQEYVKGDIKRLHAELCQLQIKYVNAGKKGSNAKEELKERMRVVELKLEMAREQLSDSGSSMEELELEEEDEEEEDEEQGAPLEDTTSAHGFVDPFVDPQGLPVEFEFNDLAGDH